MRAVRLDIEPLPAVLDMEASLAGETVVWGADNVQKRYLITKGRADQAAGEARYAQSKDDIEAAIAEGATMVRVGTAIFGERSKA